MNLAVLDLVYAALMHAQRRYPSVFNNMFQPLDGNGKQQRDFVMGHDMQSALKQLNLVRNIFFLC